LIDFYAPIRSYLCYIALKILIQLLSPTVTKLCHIKRDYLVHIICSKCPPSAETHASDRIGNSAIRYADTENPTHQRNMKWIGWPVAEIWPFEIQIRHTTGAFGIPILREGLIL